MKATGGAGEATRSGRPTERRGAVLAHSVFGVISPISVDMRETWGVAGSSASAGFQLRLLTWAADLVADRG